MFSLILFLVCMFLISAAPQSRAPLLDGRIVGGEATFIDEHPYQASLQRDYRMLGFSLYSYHICGAVIISHDYVITVAHCTEWLSACQLALRVGSTFQDFGGIKVEIDKIYQHPQYDRWTLDYDISILELTYPLWFVFGIQPISLPLPGQKIVPGEFAFVTGWGLLSEYGYSSTQLQIVDVRLVSLDDCRATYDDFSVTERMVCAGVLQGGTDSCQDDSGGPLVVNGTLIGLVSWSEGCDRPDYPDVYTNVYSLREYITEVTGI